MKKYLVIVLLLFGFRSQSQNQMHLNDKNYLEYQGVNVMLAQDFYAEGHQGGVGFI
ncbi:MAG TPA: hypothetical protein VGQ53_05110 [Chitinophagaceae bacterium]|jgi:endoglucanase|nr:hypothetical protein [Chitinophagaceae bacterium]